MSDRIVLRKVFAVDSNTGLTMDLGNVLVTNNTGGTTWTPILSTIMSAGGPIIGNLPSTLSSFSSIAYINSNWISTISSTYLQAICSLGSIIDTKIEDLGALGFITVQTLDSRLSTLASSPSTISTMAPQLSSLGFINISSLSTFSGGQALSTMSTVDALGTLGYVSSLSLFSTVASIERINSPAALQSTVAGLGNSGYVSTTKLTFELNRLGSVGYISTASLTSTVAGLGSIGYVSTGHLVSTTASLSSMKTNMRFDNLTTLNIIGGNNTNTFTNIGSLIYMSTFFQSSITYSGAQSGVQIKGKVIDDVNMEFSTAVIRLDSFSSFIDQGSRVTIEVYPTLAFTKLATSATNVVFLPISTLLKYGDAQLLEKTVTTNYLYAGNTRVVVENTNSGVNSVDASNVYNQPIRISIPKGTLYYINDEGISMSNYTFPYTLYHYMPSSINQGTYKNALHTSTITPYFGSTGSIFVTVQNSV